MCDMIERDVCESVAVTIAPRPSLEYSWFRQLDGQGRESGDGGGVDDVVVALPEANAVRETQTRHSYMYAIVICRNLVCAAA